MKNTSQILNLLLACAVIILTFKISKDNVSQEQPAQKQPSTTSDMSALDAIMTRTSIRSYTDQMVDDKQIEIMLRAAMAAPTAVNKQPWKFIVVKDKEILKQFSGVIKSAQMAQKAPLAIVVCGDLKMALPGEVSQYWIQDASAATENLLLAAHAIGLGAVWCGVYPNSERVQPVSDILGLPSHIIPLNVIPIGYPAVPARIKDKWVPEKVFQNRYTAE